MENIPEKHNEIKTLFFDIEISSRKGDYWGHNYETNIIRKTEESFILSMAWAINDGPVKVISLPDYRGYRKNLTDDKKLVENIREILESGDILVGHNIDKFDIPMINLRLLIHGLKPFAPFKTIDTYKVAGKMGFSSKSLESIARDLGIRGKRDTGGYETWEGCRWGDMKSWRKMTFYNKGDVLTNREVFKRFEPFIKNRYGVVLYKEGMPCPRCRSTRIHKKGLRTKDNIYQRYKCISCDKWLYGKLKM